MTLFILLTIAFLGAATASPAYANDVLMKDTARRLGTKITEEFQVFTAKYDKFYNTPANLEKAVEGFVGCLGLVVKMQQQEQGTAVYSCLTPFADVPSAEFNKRRSVVAHNFTVGPLNVSDAEGGERQLGLSDGKERRLDIPKQFDWREKGAVTDVKNQAQCGSCWAFATVANIEGNNFVTNRELVSLSEQELVDCDVDDFGCGAFGLPSKGYEYLKNQKKGLELESDYPYTAQDGTCKAKASLEKVFINDWASISQDEDEIAAALMKYGPLAIGINAGPMQMYMGGISDPWFCDPTALDHGVTIVAFGEEAGKKYWVIKNSWSAGWGEKGYFRMIRGKGKCGLNTMVTTAIAEKSRRLV